MSEITLSAPDRRLRGDILVTAISIIQGTSKRTIRTGRKITTVFVELDHSLVEDGRMNLGQRLFAVGKELGMDGFRHPIPGW